MELNKRCWRRRRNNQKQVCYKLKRWEESSLAPASSSGCSGSEDRNYPPTLRGFPGISRRFGLPRNKLQHKEDADDGACSCHECCKLLPATASHAVSKTCVLHNVLHFSVSDRDSCPLFGKCLHFDFLLWIADWKTYGLPLYSWAPMEMPIVHQSALSNLCLSVSIYRSHSIYRPTQTNNTIRSIMPESLWILSATEHIDNNEKGKTVNYC